MTPGQRITLTKRIGEALQGDDLADIDLVLDTFNVPGASRPKEDWERPKYEYVLQRLTRASGPVVVELHAHLYPDAPAVAADPAERRAVGPRIDGDFKLFLSHTHANKALAGEIRSALAEHGIDAFVAHEMIEPTKEWQEEIETALGTCDALAALWTPDFVGSRWCDQEVGFALGRGRLVVAIKQGADPHGFAGKYQAIPGDLSDWNAGTMIAKRIVGTLWGSDMTRPLMARSAALAYAKSTSFDNARSNTARLLQLRADEWTEEMITIIEEAGARNSQLRHGVWLASDDNYEKPLPEVVSRHLDDLLDRKPPVDTTDLESAAATGATEDDIPF